MKNNVKKYFSINKDGKEFSRLNDQEKILVEAGFNSVRQYVAEQTKVSKKKDFMDLLSDVKYDDRKTLDSNTMAKIIKYSLKKAGEDVTNFDIKDIANPSLNKNILFRQNFNTVIAQIMTPIIPAMISAQFMDFADISNIGWGETAKFVVKSNDSFYVTKMAEGINRGAIQRIYNDEIVVNPEPFNITTAVDWYLVASGVFDLGEFVYRIGLSFSNYISQMVIDGITQNIAGNVPQSYFVNGFTTLKFTRLAEILRAANAGANVRAYGTMTALSAILPDGANKASLQMQLGEEWSKVGFIDRFMDVDLMRIPQILLPNTVNTAPLTGIPDDTIYMFADGGFKPVKLVFEGTTISLDIVATDSPDKEMGLGVTMRMGSTFLSASKYGAITGVTV